MKQKLKICSMRHLCIRLRLNEDFLKKVASNISNEYKFFCKKSKSGKVRKLYTCSQKLKKINRAILKTLLNVIKIDNAAHGWCKNRSTKTYAHPHCHRKVLFSLDLKDCFPSISSKQIRALFQNDLGCSPEVSTLLTRLTTADYHLPQGFPTSGALLNIFLRCLDSKIYHFCNKHGIIYSRYGDDMAFSGQNIPLEARIDIEKIIENHGLKINKNKRKYSTGQGRQEIVGLNTAGRRLKVPRKKKKILRSLQHSLIRNPLTKDEQESKINQITGLESYISYIET